MKNTYKFNATLTVINGGQFYDVEYNVLNEGRQAVSFRTYDEAKEFFDTIPLAYPIR